MSLKKWILFSFFSLSLSHHLYSQELSEEYEIGNTYDPPQEIFLTLEKAYSLALCRNRQIINTEDAAVKAQYQIEIAASEFDVQLKPIGDVGYVGGGTGSGSAYGVGASINKKSPLGTKININPSLKKAGKKFHASFSTMVSQPLLRGLGYDYNLSHMYGAQFSYRSALRNLFIAQCQLILRTTTCLYEIIKAKKNVELSQESHHRVKKFYQAAKIKAKIGLADPLDLYRAELEMRQAEDSLKSAQERKEDAEDHLRDLLALPMDVPIQLDLPIFYSPLTAQLEEAIGAAIENRVEIDQANDQERESVRLSRVAKERLWPELNLVLNYSNCGQDDVFTNACFRKREGTWGIGFTTSKDYDPAVDRIAYEQSLLAIDVASRGMEQVLASVTFEVKKSLRQLQRTQERIELQQKQIQTAEGELRLSQIKFDRGMANNFDLIQAEKSLRNAKSNYWNALIDHIIGEFQLRNALGLLLEKPCV